MKVFTLLVFLSLSTFAQVYTPQAFGAAGNGIADDTAAIQAMINAMPDYAQAEFVAGQKFKISATLLIQDRQGLKFVGKSGVGSAASANTNAPQFLWYGAAGGTMFFNNRSRGIIYEGLTFIVNDYFLPNKANVAIDFDMNPLVPGKLTTDCLVERCSFWNSNSPNPDLAMVRIAFTSHQNCEFIVIRDSNFNSQQQSGVGVRIGPSYNAKGIRLEKNAFNRFEKGVWLVVGSMTAIGNNASVNGIDFYIDNATEPVTIAETVSESKRFLWTGASDAPVTLRANKWEGFGTEGLSPIEFGVSGSLLVLENNYFGAPPVNTPFFKPGPNARLTSHDNIFNFNKAQAGLGGFPQGVIAFNDNWRQGGGNFDFDFTRRKIRGGDETGIVKHIIGRGTDQQTASNYNVVSIDEDKIGTQFGGDVRYFGAQRFIVPTLTTNTTLTNQSPSVMMADGVTITLPAATAYLPQFKVTSPVFTIKRVGALVTLNVANGQLIEGVSTLQLLADGKTVTLISDGKQWRILSSF